MCASKQRGQRQRWPWPAARPGAHLRDAVRVQAQHCLLLLPLLRRRMICRHRRRHRLAVASRPGPPVGNPALRVRLPPTDVHLARRRLGLGSHHGGS